MDALRQKATALHMQGQFADAERLYQQILKRHPDDFQALLMSGVLAAQTQRPHRAAELFRRSLVVDPRSPLAHNNLGNVLSGLQSYAEAVASFDAAIVCAPTYADAYSNRGVALSNLGRLEEALASYDEAIRLQPDSPLAHNNRANVLMLLQRHTEALSSFDRSLAFRPNDPDMHANRGVCAMQLRRHDEALASFERCIALRPDHAEAHYTKGLALLSLGQFERGWPLLEWRSRESRTVPTRTLSLPRPRWRGEQSLRDKTLFIHWEQGFGDIIQFCRYAKAAEERGARVVLETRPELASLLRTLSPTVRIVTNTELANTADYYIPLLSLPLAFKTNLDTIPYASRYLHSDPAKVEMWRRRLGASTAPTVGLTWSGNAQQADDRRRSLTLAQLLPHLPAGIRYVSLQKDVRDTDRETLPSHRHIMDVAHELVDFSDTAALIDCLDAVVTTDTSVAHLSGALGQKTWVLLAFSPDWRWLLDRDDSPWYRGMKLFRQEQMGDWSGVLGRVRAALAALAQHDRAPPCAASK